MRGRTEPFQSTRRKDGRTADRRRSLAGDRHTEGCSESEGRNRDLIRRFYEELWNRFDRRKVSDLLTADVRFRGSLGQEKRGHSGFTEYMDMIETAFPDFTNAVEEIVSEGNRAFARLTYRGTHRGTLFGIPPTRRRVEYAGAALFRFRGRKIAEVWVLGDVYGLLQQLRGTPAKRARNRARRAAPRQSARGR